MVKQLLILLQGNHKTGNKTGQNYKDVEERNQAAKDNAHQAAVHVAELNTKY